MERPRPCAAPVTSATFRSEGMGWVPTRRVPASQGGEYASEAGAHLFGNMVELGRRPRPVVRNRAGGSAGLQRVLGAGRVHRDGGAGGRRQVDGRLPVKRSRILQDPSATTSSCAPCACSSSY